MRMKPLLQGSVNSHYLNRCLTHHRQPQSVPKLRTPLLAFAYLGGIGSVSGALVAGVIAPGGLAVALIAKGFSGDSIGTYANLVGGVGLILTAILNTDGIAGKVARDNQAKRQVRPKQIKEEALLKAG